jgi:hypothetical protein
MVVTEWMEGSTMKYFTENWHKGEFSELKTETIRQAYWQHLQTLQSRFSEQVFELANKINLHDSLIRKVISNTKDHTLLLELMCGDLSTGYFELELKYKGVDLMTSDLNILRTVTLEKKNEILYDEVDVSQEGYIHRLLFWPYREIDINFTELSLRKRPSLNRNTPTPVTSDRFIEIKESDPST